MDTLEEATQMEINICNTDSKSQIVLNDLQLLELLYSYPFLFSKAVRAHGDKDYEEWGWQEIAKRFNMSYKGLQLNTPFTVEELQWRWEVLRPVCPSLGKACGQIPDSLWYIICKINRLLNVKTPVSTKSTSSTQKLICNQLPILEKLSQSQQKRLEVEVLDAILTHERSIHLEALSKKAEDIVQNQYDEFLRAIRVKELPSNEITGKDFDSSKNNLNTTNILNTSESNLENKELRTNTTFGKNNLISTTIDNSRECNLVISSVGRLMESQDEETTHKASKQGPNTETVTNLTGDEVRFVPLKSAKYYTKRVKVRLKRVNLDDYMPLPR
ncbi:hypothetical protein ACLKA6_020018 [Drosophila palustris]